MKGIYMELLGFGAIIIVIAAGIGVFPFLKGGKTIRKTAVIANAVFCAGYIALFIMNTVSTVRTEQDRSQYDIYGSSLLSGWKYDKTEDGFHYLHTSGFMYINRYIVPAESCTVSPMARLSGDVYVYAMHGNTISAEQNTEIDRNEYIFEKNIIKIMPNYISLTLYSIIFGGAACVLFNIVMLIIVIIKSIVKKTKNGD